MGTHGQGCPCHGSDDDNRTAPTALRVGELEKQKLEGQKSFAVHLVPDSHTTDSAGRSLPGRSTMASKETNCAVNRRRWVASTAYAISSSSARRKAAHRVRLAENA